MTDNLSRFGNSFQTKVITSLLKDSSFIQQIGDILVPDMFDSDGNKWLVEHISEYFFKYKHIPTLDVLKIQVDDIANDILQVSVIEKLKAAWSQLEATDLEFVQEKILEFCKNQVLKTAIIDSVDLLESGEYDAIKGLIDEAMKAGAPRDLGHDYITGLEARLTNNVRDTIATPWNALSELMDGGLAAGELGVVVAPAGIGKSWILQAIAAAGIRAGLKVVYYTMELNEHYVGTRFDTIFSHVPTANIKYHKEDVAKALSGLAGNMTVKYYPQRAAGVTTLMAHIKQMELQQIQPDLVIVDYADLLRDTSGAKDLRFQLRRIYEDLRGMAGELGVPVWTASQSSRSSLEEDIIGAEKIAEDYSKVMTADFVMSISRKVEDKIADTGRCHIIKNRFGRDGITLPMKMNTDSGIFEMYEELSHNGQKQQGRMDDREEFKRRELSKKYQTLVVDEEKTGGFE